MRPTMLSSTSRKAWCVLVWFWAFACNEPHPGNTALLITPHTQALGAELGADTPHPLCRVLSRLGGRRRGASIDVTLASDDTLIVAQGPELDSVWMGCSVSRLDQATRSDLRDCTATHNERELCVLTLPTLLEAALARYEAVPLASRGQLLLNLSAVSDAATRDRYATALTNALTTFSPTEQLWLTSTDSALLARVRQELEANARFNVRYGLFIQDQNAVVGDSGLETALAGADIALVPEQLYDVLYDDLSRVALFAGGTALGAYRVDTIPAVHNMLRHDGVRMIIGELAPAFEGPLSIESPGAFDCEAFISAQGLTDRLFANPSGTCP